MATVKCLAASSVAVATAASRFLYRVTPLPRHPAQGLEHPRGPAHPQAPRAPAGRTQPRESHLLPRRASQSQASCHPDHLLRRRPAHFRGPAAAAAGHRLAAHGPAGRAGQGRQGSLRHAPRACCRCCATTGGTADRTASGSSPACSPVARSAPVPSSGPAGWHCLFCQYQFIVTAGTITHDPHLPLCK